MVHQQGAEPAIIKGAETIDLQEGGSHGVLLLHGFGDTPQTLSLLARRLARNGDPERNNGSRRHEMRCTVCASATAA
jgi:hypothetical protein